MSGGWAARLAWATCAFAVGLQLVAWTLNALADALELAFDPVSVLVVIGTSVVGALVASRHPGNAIGWLFCGTGLLLALAGASYEYAAYALIVSPDLPWGLGAAWLTSWVFLPAVFGVPPLLFLLFPDGRPLDGWMPVVVLTVAGVICQGTGAALRPGALEDAPRAGIENPLGAVLGAGVVGAVELVGWALCLLGVVLGTASLVMRYRRSRGDQRLQMRWFAFSALLFVLACAVSVALLQTELAGVGQFLVVASFCTIPVAAGIAILRYRLYDIDVVINRTLVYGALTATLAATYLGSVLVLQRLMRPLTSESDLAVAASTLVAAGLFRPARSRIQAAVDRRFFRSRYDAARTLDAFATRLRQEVDLDTVGTDLRGVVRETMQPARVSLWLRGAQP